MVKWAIATLEWIYFDTEDENNKDHAADTFPFDAGKKNPRIYYCYYSGQYIIKLTSFRYLYIWFFQERGGGGVSEIWISWYE